MSQRSLIQIEESLRKKLAETDSILTVNEAKEPDYDELIQNPNVRKMLDLIGRAEGADYNTIVGGKKFKDLSKHPMTVGLRTKQGPSTAAGKYQITGTNWKNYADRLGLPDFGPESQDKIAAAMLHDRGALKDVLKGDFVNAIKKTGSQWTSLPASEIKQGLGPRSWKWVEKNLADIGTQALATATGSGNAAATELPPQKVKTKSDQVDKIPTPKPATPPSPTPAAPTQTLKLTADQAKKLPPVDMFGHIFPGVDINKAGGIGGVSTKPYTLPDGTTITDKRTLADIRSLQQQPNTRTISGPVTTAPAASTAAPEIKLPNKAPGDSTATTPAASAKKLSDFEQAFAAARKEQGAGGEFAWTNPRTGVTGRYTTDYATEKPASKSATPPMDKAPPNIRTSLSNVSTDTIDTQVDESVNTELQDILKLAGRK